MIISVTSLKGGVGKSTITQNLAVCFAHSGYKVCIADADTNQSALRWSSLRDADLPPVPAFGTPEKTLSSNIKPRKRANSTMIYSAACILRSFLSAEHSAMVREARAMGLVK